MDSTSRERGLDLTIEEILGVGTRRAAKWMPELVFGSVCSLVERARQPVTGFIDAAYLFAAIQWGSPTSRPPTNLPSGSSFSPLPLPTPVTPTLTRSFRARIAMSSSPYPPPAGDLPALLTHMKLCKLYTPSIAPKELSNTGRKYAGAAIGLPSSATSVSGTAAPGAGLSPTSTRFRQASTGSGAPRPTSTLPTVSAPFSQTPANQWSVPQVIAWLQSKGFDAEVQHAFQENDITGDVPIELGGPVLKDELGVTAFGKLKREDKKARKKENSKEKLAVGSRWSGSSRPTSAIGDDEDQLKVRLTGHVVSGTRRAIKQVRGVLSEDESSHKPGITKAKQFFDQPESQRTPTAAIKTSAKTDPSEAGSTQLSTPSRVSHQSVVCVRKAQGKGEGCQGCDR
ncbi:unnamed protein product [Rhizoctonia solani]|uniref:SAM domain-containing protein n=1 Tax=Rhizoctonia solani TaxID=456999 RepID=A0A8H3HRR2_9AGAM|nr:unnamed protein product [Rhizoctonia solani]